MSRDIPRDLAAVCPKYFVELGSRRVVGFMIPIAYIGVYAFATALNGWVRLLPTLLGPIMAGIFLTVSPWDPYKSMYVSKSDPIIADPRAAQVRMRLRSNAARRIVWKAAALSTVVLAFFVFVTSVLAKPPRSWDFNFGEVLIASGILGMFSMGWMFHSLLHWLVRAWRDERRE